MMRVCQRQRRHLWESSREWLLVPPFTRHFLKSPSSRGLYAIDELLVVFALRKLLHCFPEFGRALSFMEPCTRTTLDDNDDDDDDDDHNDNVDVPPSCRPIAYSVLLLSEYFLASGYYSCNVDLRQALHIIYHLILPYLRLLRRILCRQNKLIFNYFNGISQYTLGVLWQRLRCYYFESLKSHFALFWVYLYRNQYLIVDDFHTLHYHEVDSNRVKANNNKHVYLPEKSDTE